MRTALLRVLAVGTLGLLLGALGCGGGGGGPPGDGEDDGGGVSPEDLDLKIAVNPDDPLLLDGRTPDGHRIRYYGPKDAEGRAQSVRNARVDAPNGDTTVVEFDEQDRVRRIRSEDDTVLEFEWVSATDVVVTGTSPDGTVQLTTSVDLAPYTADRACPPCASPIEPPHAVPADLSNVMRVVLCQCGFPVGNATVRLYVRGDGPGVSVPCRHVGNGAYEGSAPLTSRSGASTESKCAALSSALEWTCAGVVVMVASGAANVFCAKLALAVGAGAPPAALAILAACPGMFITLAKVCALSGWGLPDGIGWTEVLCAAPRDTVDNHVTGANLSIQAYVTIPGQQEDKTHLFVRANAPPFSDFDLDLQGSTRIESVAIEPADPAPHQAYTVRAQFVCAGTDTQVRIRVVGTDTFDMEQDYTISGNQACTLSVPGGGAEIEDEITVTVLGTVIEVVKRIRF